MNIFIKTKKYLKNTLTLVKSCPSFGEYYILSLKAFIKGQKLVPLMKNAKKNNNIKEYNFLNIKFSKLHTKIYMYMFLFIVVSVITSLFT
jgi:hypothetical protein